MSLRKSLLQRIVVVVMLASLDSRAARRQVLDAAAFQAAQASGKPILIEIHADWWPTCMARVSIFDRLSGRRRFAGLARIRVAFDARAAGRHHDPLLNRPLR